MGSSVRGGESDSEKLLLDSSSDTAGSEWSTPTETSVSPAVYDACSHRDRDDMQELIGALSRIKVAKGLVRMPSSKSRRPASRKGLGGAEQKRKLKKLRSVKRTGLDGSSSGRKWSLNYDEQPSISINEADSLPNYLKATRSSDVRKVSVQSSPHKPESSISSSDRGGKILNSFKLSAARNKPVIGFRRTASLRPVRILAKMPSLKPKRPSTKKCSEISEVSDLSVHRATCSSAIKDSKFPAQVENKQGGDVPEKVSAMKVCPYSYCSLHGHRHAAPTLKRLKSARKRVKSQRSNKLSGLSRSEGNDVGRENSHKAEKDENELSEEINSEKDVLLSAADRVEKGEEVAEVAITEKKKQSKAANPQVVGEENLALTSDLSSADRDLLEPSSTSPEVHIQRESEERILESINAEKEESKERPSGGKVKFVSVGVQTDLEPEDLGGELLATDCIASDPHDEISEAVQTLQETGDEEPPLSGEVSPGDSTSTSDQSDSSKTADIGEEEDEAKAVGGISPNEELASMHEEIKQNLQSAGEPKEALPDSREDHESPGEPTKPPSSSLEEPTLTCKDENMESLVESEPDSTGENSLKSSFGRRKFNGLWYLIYQHMVSDVAENGGVESPVDRDNKEEQVISANMLSELDRDPKLENRDDAAQQEELQQSDAVKLLQEAISKILEQSREQSSVRKAASHDINFDQMETTEDPSVTCENEKEAVSEEEKREAHEVPKAEEERGVNAGARPNQLASKRWSNLKKYILMRRFIKAVEKTKNFGWRIPRYLSSEVSPDHDKVNLRRQQIEGRKSAEEWMLDHALQKAMSKLDPAQKRRVGLLVEAFETVNPTPGGKTHRSMSTSFPSIHDNSEAMENSSVKIQELTAAENVATGRKSLANIDIPRMQLPEDYVESRAVEVPISSSQVHDEPKDRATACNLDDGDTKLMTTEEPIEAVEGDGDTVVERDAISGSFSPKEDRPTSSADVADEPQLEKKKYTGLWYLIYKQMASGLETEQGSEPIDPLVDGNKKEEEEDETENEEDEKRRRSPDTDSPDSFESEQAMLMDPEMDREEMKFRKIEAVKLVQQAIDKILQQCEDSSRHDRYNTGDGVLEQESKEKSRSNNGETSLPTSNDSTEDSYMRLEKMKEQKSVSDPEIQIKSDTSAPQEEDKTNLQGAKKLNSRPVKNWNNLRKVILMKRFVKALETKVSNFNPREPRYLPLDPDMEPEKVSLKHQDMDERKSSEEYLLDYALQRVVSRLTPARKRKVHLLVEAFETITPPVGK